MDNNTILLVQHYEGCKLTSYQDSVGVWTIGWGNTHYQDGTPVKHGDTITQQQADDLFKFYLQQFYDEVSNMLEYELADTEIGALTSFAYNIGIGNLKSSTLLKKINADPDDPTIQQEFEKWDHAGGVVLPGLLKRRKSEAYLYFTGELKFDF